MELVPLQKSSSYGPIPGRPDSSKKSDHEGQPLLLSTKKKKKKKKAVEDGFIQVTAEPLPWVEAGRCGGLKDKLLYYRLALFDNSALKAVLLMSMSWTLRAQEDARLMVAQAQVLENGDPHQELAMAVRNKLAQKTANILNTAKSKMQNARLLISMSGAPIKLVRKYIDKHFVLREHSETSGSKDRDTWFDPSLPPHCKPSYRSQLDFRTGGQALRCLTVLDVLLTRCLMCYEYARQAVERNDQLPFKVFLLGINLATLAGQYVYDAYASEML